jgi:hypothetical protein
LLLAHFAALHVEGIPAGANATFWLAPPGWYMLFLLNGAGIPSAAHWLNVS